MNTRARFLVLATASLLALPGCGQGVDDAAQTSAVTTTTTRPPAASSGLPLVVDTDLAADDIVALSYLMARPDFDLRAVTVTGTGEVRCPRGADIARGLLARAGRDDVPVACGSSTPLTGSRAFPDPWRDSADKAYGLLLETVTPPADQTTAVALLTETVTASSQRVVLLTLGPLTNVAEALAADPELGGNIERIVVMGGAVDVPGNVQLDGASEPLAAEWNIYVDPAAAAAVIGSGVPVTLVGLDATNAVPVTEDVIERLAANDTTEATSRVLQLFDLFPPPYLWDPLAAIAATDPVLVPTHPEIIAVATDGDDAGRTISAADGTRIDVAGPPDADVVIDHLLATLAAVPDGGQLVVPTTLPILGSFTVGFDGGQCTFDGPSTLAPGRYEFSATPGDVAYWVAIAHFVGDATGQDAIDWVMQHPDDDPPMVDDVAAIGEDGQPSTDIMLAAGNAGVICLSEGNTIDLAADLVVTD